jgi:hypothetical protein
MVTIPLYIRDLSPTIRADVMLAIEQQRPGLLQAIEQGEDVEIGELWQCEQFKVSR